MVLLDSRLILFALCSFSIGSWVGFYWRGRLSFPKSAILQRLSAKQKSTLRTIGTQQNGHILSEGGKNCLSQHNIMFLKTHKTASSAVQNVLLRHAGKYNLTVGLSKTNDIRFHYGQKFQKSFLSPTENPINILCHHMVFNLLEVQKVMPHSSSYITILREPASLFESMFDYFHYDSTPFSRVKNQPRSLAFWLNHTDVFFHGRNDGRFWWFAKNGVFFDMGYDNLSDDDMYIQDAIRELDETFDLVLLSDYFARSMLLLKDHLCWSMEDILALKINARDSARTVLTEKLIRKIREWNKADAAVYDHFNHSFWKKVEEYGPERMENDMKLLESMNEKLKSKCIEGDSVSNKFIKDARNKVYNPRGVVMQGYNIKESARNDSLCVNLLKGEIQWTRELMAKNNKNGKN